MKAQRKVEYERPDLVQNWPRPRPGSILLQGWSVGSKDRHCMGNFLLETLPLALEVSSQKENRLGNGPPAIHNFKPEILVGIHCTEIFTDAAVMSLGKWT